MEPGARPFILKKNFILCIGKSLLVFIQCVLLVGFCDNFFLKCSHLGNRKASPENITSIDRSRKILVEYRGVEQSILREESCVFD
jgi:hypothetical protein